MPSHRHGVLGTPRPYQTGDSVGSRVPRDLDAEIAATAQAILDARARYPESSLADLYDPLAMPPDLRAAHEANDRAVLAAYGLAPDTPKPEIVAHLFKRYADREEEAGGPSSRQAVAALPQRPVADEG